MPLSKGQTNNKKGRPKGARDRVTLELNKWLENDIMVRGDYRHPITILLEVANDKNVPIELRIRAAEKILPYISRRMAQAVEVTGSEGGAIEVSLSGAKDALTKLLDRK